MSICRGLEFVLCLLLAGSAPLEGQSKPCGRETPTEAKNWKLIPCDESPELGLPSVLALRTARGLIFDDPTGRKRPEDLAHGDTSRGQGRSSGFPIEYPPLPFSESDTVVVGSVIDYQPYFSNDRTAIYHEFTISIESLLKKDSSPGQMRQTLAILGEGGSIRQKNGRVFTQFVPPAIQNDIRVGGRYVLFLVYRPSGDHFGLIKAWNLRAGQAVPMAQSDIEKSRNGRLPLAGMSEEAFLAELREILSRPD